MTLQDDLGVKKRGHNFPRNTAAVQASHPPENNMIIFRSDPEHKENSGAHNTRVYGVVFQTLQE
ncbi:hypothetical protein VQ7734_02719 [Vibrio quintilis]|uniref:Uncharacterized protein n=1 Tax=Vibrio quintilis TaxID=1117707 RepID=A0A1M7YW68_9VIBR|nr:hypothetical protein VQ7734_02719 [Vibrio quintilis]